MLRRAVYLNSIYQLWSFAPNALYLFEKTHWPEKEVQTRMNLVTPPVPLKLSAILRPCWAPHVPKLQPALTALVKFRHWFELHFDLNAHHDTYGIITDSILVTLVSRGKRGAWWHPPSFRVALGDIHLRFAWQAWHLWHWAGLVARLGGTSRRWRRGTLRGRRGTWWHPPSFHVAGVAHHAIHLRFAGPAWHLWHWASSGGALGAGLVAGDAAALCVAGVALGDIHLRFAWQVWHLATFTCVLRGRRGTCGTGLGWWRAWAGLVAGDAAALCVAGVALGDIHLRFAWQLYLIYLLKIVIFHSYVCLPEANTTCIHW